MNNLKKLGLTALAGSLVATSVSAGEMSVSAGASLDYSSSSEGLGNNWSMGDSVNFSGSGDVNGMDVTLAIELDGGTYDDYSLKVDTGDMGAVTFSGNSVGAGGLNAYGDKVPTAYEEVYDATDGTDNGIPGNISSTNAFAYNGTFGNITLSAFHNPASVSSSSIVLVYADLIDGLTIGYGTGEVGAGTDEETLYMTYTTGGLTFGYQKSKIDLTGAGNDKDTDHVGISFAVNENLTVSAGKHDVEFSTVTKDEESTGVSASYTTGGLTIAGHANGTDNQNGGSENEDSKSVNFSFAF